MEEGKRRGGRVYKKGERMKREEGSEEKGQGRRRVEGEEEGGRGGGGWKGRRRMEG